MQSTVRHNISLDNEYPIEASSMEEFSAALLYALPASSDRLVSELQIGEHHYPIVMTESADYRSGSNFFRAGKYLVLSTFLNFRSFDTEKEITRPVPTVETMLRTAHEIEDVLFCHGSECWRRGYRYNSTPHARGYYLPNTIGCMIALQQLGLENSSLKGRTILDIGAGSTIMSQTGLKEGADRAITIEPNPDEPSIICYSQYFKNLQYNGHIYRPKCSLEANGLVNGTLDRMNIYKTTIKAAPSEALAGGIAVINFPDFGLRFIDADQATLRQHTKRVGPWYDIDLPKSESVLGDVVKKWQGIEYAIVSGGHRSINRRDLFVDESAKLLAHAEKLGFELKREISVCQPCRGALHGEIFDEPKLIDDTIQYLTFVLQRR